MPYLNLQKLVSISKEDVPFYKELYKSVTAPIEEPSHVPIATFDDVMTSVHDDPFSLFSKAHSEGMYYTTSGTTGKPKHTIFGKEEWKHYIHQIAAKHWKNGLLKKGDVVTNLSEPGSASYMTMHGVLSAFPESCSEIPIGCDTEYSKMLTASDLFSSNVISGINPTIVAFAHYVLQQVGPLERVERILAGGELFFGSQLDLIKKAFPNAEYFPFIYGAAEAGLIGYNQRGLNHHEFKPFTNFCTVEIVDADNGMPIVDVEKEGILIVTNHIRVSAPVIRFSTGDIAKWIVPPSEQEPVFALLGRLSYSKTKIGKTSISSLEIQKIIQDFNERIPIIGFQIILSGTGEHTSMEIVVSPFSDSDVKTLSDTEVNEIMRPIVLRHLPDLDLDKAPSSVSLTAKVEDFSYFYEQCKRKWKYIIDNRQ